MHLAPSCGYSLAFHDALPEFFVHHEVNAFRLRTNNNDDTRVRCATGKGHEPRHDAEAEEIFTYLFEEEPVLSSSLASSVLAPFSSPVVQASQKSNS